MIYVEARSAQQVNQACKGLVGICPSRGILLVPIEEIASLLQIEKQDLTVTPGSWVRIKRRKYQGDLGQVMVITENGEDVGLKFIPCIQPEAGFKTESGRCLPERYLQGRLYRKGLQIDCTVAGKRVNGAKAKTSIDLSIIAEASCKAAIAVLQLGDHVEVFEGEQSSVHGVVDSINQDVATIMAVGIDIDGQKVNVPAHSIWKRFKPRDHVKESLFSKDLREAAWVGTGTNIVGNYELHDLVQLDLKMVGVIFKTEHDSFQVLDRNGQAIATDSEGHELRVNDNVRKIEGENRKGRVLHIHQSFFAFLHNRDVPENGALDEGDGGELSTAILKEISLRQLGQSGHRTTSCIFSKTATPEPRTPGPSFQTTTSPEFIPIVVHINYSLRNPIDGIQSVLPTDAYPYIDNPWEKCMQEFEFVLPRYLEDPDPLQRTNDLDFVVVCTGDKEDLPQFMQLATHYIDPFINSFYCMQLNIDYLLPEKLDSFAEGRYDVINAPGSQIQSESEGKRMDTRSQIEDLNIVKRIISTSKIVQSNRSAACPSIGRALSMLTMSSTASAATRNLPSSLRAIAPPSYRAKRPPPPPLRPKPKPEPEYITALYDVDALAEGDLSFKTGDCIEVITKTDSQEDWWAGCLPQNPSLSA
ncbi:hypothetical protein EDD15DRAFT_2400825 [Pisolithus albus]|nr:hypothetical protein EDD15DRAFT_2400825 [Pisolithus albus]